MCGEHQLLQHLATTHRNKRSWFSSAKKLSASNPLPTSLCSAHQEDCALALWPGGCCWTQGGGGAGLCSWGHRLACSEERSSSAPTLGPVTSGVSRGAAWEEGSQTPSLQHPQLQYVPRLRARLWVNKSLLLDRKVFPQRICLDLGLGWYRCNRQYVQGSGKLVLKLSGCRELQCLEVIMTCRQMKENFTANWCNSLFWTFFLFLLTCLDQYKFFSKGNTSLR